MSGWIKIHRKILDWEWYSDHKTFRLFIHLILVANHKDKKYKGRVVKKGCLITSREMLSLQTGLSIREIRNCLNKLKATNETTIKTGSQGTEIQLVNYDKYQLATSEETNKRPASDHQTTTNKKERNKEDKNNIIFDFFASSKKEQSVSDRVDDFKKELDTYVGAYGEKVVDDFFLYWSELNKSKTKMRKELNKTWDTNLRLKRWNSNNFNKTKSNESEFNPFAN